MNCHGKNPLQPILKRMYFLNSCRISGHSHTTFTTIAQIEQILQESKDPTGLFSRDTGHTCSHSPIVRHLIVDHDKHLKVYRNQVIIYK